MEDTNTIDEFYRNYRDTLRNTYDASVQALNQQRQNDYASIMSNANRAGMLYSNLPARDKVKYDIGTYQPALVKAQQTYQTGLDTLRANALKAANNIASLQDQIAHLNSLAVNK